MRALSAHSESGSTLCLSSHPSMSCQTCFLPQVRLSLRTSLTNYSRLFSSHGAIPALCVTMGMYPIPDNIQHESSADYRRLGDTPRVGILEIPSFCLDRQRGQSDSSAHKIPQKAETDPVSNVVPYIASQSQRSFARFLRHEGGQSQDHWDSG